MKTINIEDFKKGIVAAHKQHGESGITFAKSLMLEGAMLVDMDGNPIDPESVDIVVKASAGGEADMMKPEEKPEEMKCETADCVSKSVSKALSLELDSVPNRKAVRVSAPEAFKMYKGVKHFKSAEQAYRFGKFLMATANHSKSVDWCNANGIHLKGHQEGVNSQGGFLVPEEFSNEIITLREQFGVFRKYAGIKPMSRDTLTIPRRTAGLTAYWTGEAKAGTESTQTFDQIQLVAKKMMVLTTTSNELSDDAIVNIADDVAREIAYEFSKKEDDAGFNGDGTSTYGGIIGLANAMGSAGVVDTTLSTGSLFTTATATIAQYLGQTMAALPEYAFTPNTKFYMHKTVYHAAVERVTAFGGGGSNVADITGAIRPNFLGYEVVFVQSMPKATTTTDGTILWYFGDLSQAAYLGDRKAVEIKVSDSALNAFEQDEVVIRGVQRLDIVCANCGDATNAGTIVQGTR